MPMWKIYDKSLQDWLAEYHIKIANVRSFEIMSSVDDLTIIRLEIIANTVGKIPAEEYHDGMTLNKVMVALAHQGLSYAQIVDAINAMQNQGILFRERSRED